jgi:hypothetical protein
VNRIVGHIIDEVEHSTRTDARTGADLIVEHVRDRDLVDGAGNPIGGTR